MNIYFDRQCPPGAMAYRIQTGDTLYRIAQKFDTTVQSILALNPGIVPERLFIGQIICIPRTQPICPPGSTAYVVKSGDTLAEIARRFNTSVRALLVANPGIIPEALSIGQVICVPQAEPECPIGTSPYEIKMGDTIAIIASRFGITVRDILDVNPSVVPEKLHIGQVICIPPPMTLEPPCPSLNYYVIQAGDTLAAIARVFNTTVQRLMEANPGINPNALNINQVICIPRSASSTHIIISLAAKTLAFYRGGNLVKVYPVAIGKPSTPTPRGNFTIVNKQVNPGGAFGSRWMGLSEPHYGIHGTNNPASIGTAASNGCIRMHNRDVNELFNQVAVGTTVDIH